MIKLTAEEEVEYFQSLSYKEKLEYFDTAKISFTSETYFFNSNEHFINIRPSNNFELKLYSKWVIDHWRNIFHNEFHQKHGVVFTKTFKYFEQFKERYSSVVVKSTNVDKLDYITNEIEEIKRFIFSLKIKSNIVAKVFDSICSESEDEIYVYNKYHISNAVLYLMGISGIVDTGFQSKVCTWV